MRIFVTGASGFIGSAIVQELKKAGHQVIGLARSDQSEQSLRAARVIVHRGSLEDSASLTKGAAESDGVIHTGFIHDFSKFKENCEIDERAIKALGAGLAGSDRPLIVTSGTALLSPGVLSTEEMRKPAGSLFPRVSEEAAFSLLSQGVNAMVVRMPPSVHGDGDHGFVPLLIDLAREKGVSAYVGEGLNRWPAVHRLDAATLYKLVLEKGVSGRCYHGIADQGVPFREIAEVIGRRLNIPVVSKSPEEAAGHFGWFAHFVGVDVPSSSKKTSEELGWQPKHSSLIEDIDRPVYFETEKEHS